MGRRVEKQVLFAGGEVAPQRLPAPSLRAVPAGERRPRKRGETAPRGPGERAGRKHSETASRRAGEGRPGERRPRKRGAADPRGVALHGAFAGAARRYWLRVFPALCAARRAHVARVARIENPLLREVATRGLQKWGNVEGAAAFAAFVPAARRRAALRALVSFQSAYNYLDTLSETPAAIDPARARALHGALLFALGGAQGGGGRAARGPEGRDAGTAGGSEGCRYAQGPPQGVWEGPIDDGGYLAETVTACRAALGQLPGYGAVVPAALRAAARIAGFQGAAAAQAAGDWGALERWGLVCAPADLGLSWWEAAAASGSSLGVFALIAAGARADGPAVGGAVAVSAVDAAAPLARARTHAAANGPANEDTLAAHGPAVAPGRAVSAAVPAVDAAPPLARAHTRGREWPRKRRHPAREGHPDREGGEGHPDRAALARAHTHAAANGPATDDTLAAEIALVERAYFPWVGALHSLLDNLVDLAEDRATGQHSLIRCYGTAELASARMGVLAERSLGAAAALPGGDGDVLLLAAMASFYLATPEAQTPQAAPVAAAVLDALGEPVRLAMAVFRARLALRRAVARVPRAPAPRRAGAEVVLPAAPTDTPGAARAARTAAVSVGWADDAWTIPAAGAPGALDAALAG